MALDIFGLVFIDMFQNAAGLRIFAQKFVHFRVYRLRVAVSGALDQKGQAVRSSTLESKAGVYWRSRELDLLRTDNKDYVKSPAELSR